MSCRSNLCLGSDFRHGPVRKQAHDFKTVGGGLGGILIGDLNGKRTGRSDCSVCIFNGNDKEPCPRKLRVRGVHDIFFNVSDLFRREGESVFRGGKIGEVFIFAAVLVEAVICERLPDLPDRKRRVLCHPRGSRDGQGKLHASVFKNKFLVLKILRFLRSRRNLLRLRRRLRSCCGSSLGRSGFRSSLCRRGLRRSDLSRWRLFRNSLRRWGLRRNRLRSRRLCRGSLLRRSIYRVILCRIILRRDIKK